jgi:hypothetical protein
MLEDRTGRATRRAAERVRWTDMTRLWQVVAIGVLGVAACQWLSIGDQIVHGAVLTLKTGWTTPVLTVGTRMLGLFLVLTAVATVAGSLAFSRLRGSLPGFARCARAATYSLVGGAAIWLGLIVSPLVDLVQR